MELAQTIPLSALERAIRRPGRALTSAIAHEILSWQLSPHDDQRLDELAARNREGKLTESDSEDLAELCQTVDLLSLLHLYAREAIGDLPQPGV